MTVRYLPRANADLENIADWIARDSPERSLRFVLKLRTACEELADRPALYRVVPGHRDLRRRLVPPYLIFFRVRGGEVTIVSVRHVRRGRLP